MLPPPETMQIAISRLKFQNFYKEEADLKVFCMKELEVTPENQEAFNHDFERIDPKKDCENRVEELAEILGEKGKALTEAFRAYNNKYFQNEIYLRAWGRAIRSILNMSMQLIENDASFLEKHLTLRNIIGWLAKMVSCFASEERKRKIHCTFFAETNLQKKQGELESLGKRIEVLHPGIAPIFNHQSDGQHTRAARALIHSLEFDETLDNMDRRLRELDKIFKTIERLDKQYYTEEGKHIDELIKNFSEEQMGAILEEIDNAWICPITQQIIREPVKPADGKRYERCALQQWYDEGGHRVCPIDRSIPLVIPTTLPVDDTLQQEIISFLQERLEQIQSSAKTPGSP